ncbi:Membrane-bound transcription factor site-2 protease [Actinomortierella wolfii]|nr:Membrane-bound transcription factor site-2 protease [Actinomortierella wolfii]
MIRLYCQPAPWITDKKVGCNHQVDPAYTTAEDDDAEDDEEDYDEEGDGNDPTLARNPSRIVLYQGDPRDIWDGVQVTNMKTRWSFLPLGLPNATMLTLQYIMSFSLALSILNIVPARHLDGHHALKSLWHLGRMMSYSYKNSGSIAQTVQECLMVDVATAADEDKDSTSASGATTMGGGATGTSSSNSAAIAASLSLSTAVSSSSKKAPILIKGIVVTSSILLGGVMFGSLLQMVIQLYI